MNNFDKIEAYLFDMLDAAGRASFEQEMANDSELRAAVAQQQLEHRAMELAVRDDLRNQMAAWDLEDTEETTAPLTVSTAPTMQVSFIRRNFFKIAAAASVLLVIGFFSRSLFEPSGDVNALAYFNSTTRSSGSLDAMPEVLRPGLSALKNGQYDNAIAAFAQVQDPNFLPQATLFMGECYFRQQKYDAALDAFEKVESMQATGDQKESAQWFRLLTYKAAGKDQDMKALKDVIRENKEHSFWEEAGKVR